MCEACSSILQSDSEYQSLLDRMAAAPSLAACLDLAVHCENRSRSHRNAGRFRSAIIYYQECADWVNAYHSFRLPGERE